MPSDRDIDWELQFHLEERADELVARGLAPDSARAQARLELGGLTQTKEAIRDRRGWTIAAGLWQDVRLALRTFRTAPLITALAILSLALGIGANTAIFSLVSALVLRPLPVQEPAHLFLLSTGAAGASHPQFSYATFKEIRDHVETLDGALGYTACCGKAIVGAAGSHESADRQVVTGEFFETLGVRAYRGRLLTPADDTPAAPEGPVAVVSYRYWQQHLGGRDTVVGMPLMMDGVLLTIVGVLLARGIARRHELSVRVALGASRWRISRQLVVESLALASIGTALGLTLALWLSRVVLAHLSTTRAPIVLDTSLDWRVLAFAVTTALATALLFGTAPALRAARTAPIDALRTAGRDATVSRSATLSSSVIVAQVTLALVLVVAAGLFVRTFERLVRVSLGVDVDRTLVVSVTASTVPAADRPGFVQRMAEKVAALPGVQAAGGGLNPPIAGEIGGADLVVSLPGTLPPPDAPRIPHVDLITPGWFAAYGIPIDFGRDFEARDAAIDAPLVMIVNEAFVRRLFPGRRVVGMTLTMAWRIGLGDRPYGTRTIVGVVRDSVYHEVREPVQPMVFLPLSPRDPLLQRDFYLSVRAATGSPALLKRTLRDGIASVSPDVAFSIESLAQQVDDSLAENRVIALLSAFFGGLALVLAALGLYGVTAYAVAQRRGEIGIRLALGASRHEVMRLVLGRLLMLISIGIGVGIVAASATATYATSLLFDLAPRDPVTMAGAAAVLFAVGAAAGGWPAWRASSMNPANVFREN